MRYTIVDDFGFTLNPLLLAGQVHGGIAQGVGQALMEKTVYDEAGQLLTASFMDYCMPRADNLPNFSFETRNVPSTTNPLGLKGAGEAGSIGSTPGRHERGRRRALAGLRHRPHRHAGDACGGFHGDQERAAGLGRPGGIRRALGGTAPERFFRAACEQFQRLRLRKLSQISKAFPGGLPLLRSTS